MNRELYNIIINGYFTHSIGKIYDNDILNKLESIFKLGGIYSKDSLRKLGITIEGRVVGNIRMTKDFNVSLFDPSGYNLEKGCYHQGLVLFFLFLKRILFF